MKGKASLRIAYSNQKKQRFLPNIPNRSALNFCKSFQNRTLSSAMSDSDGLSVLVGQKVVDIFVVHVDEGHSDDHVLVLQLRKDN